MKVKELPKSYSEKYDDETVANLAALLESIEHFVHILNGVKADILGGTYTQSQAQLDCENIMYLDGVDAFSTLQEVADSPWTDKAEGGVL
jgi:hypothetical protein